jgi:hypothetical protein
MCPLLVRVEVNMYVNMTSRRMTSASLAMATDNSSAAKLLDGMRETKTEMESVLGDER